MYTYNSNASYACAGPCYHLQCSDHGPVNNTPAPFDTLALLPLIVLLYRTLCSLRSSAVDAENLDRVWSSCVARLEAKWATERVFDSMTFYDLDQVTSAALAQSGTTNHADGCVT